MKKFYILIIIFILIFIGFFLFEKFSYVNIIVKFEDLEPFEGSIPVYYKGVKIGKSTNMYIDKDFSNTYLNLKLKPRKINLPENIKADLKISGDKPYVKILYPNSPAIKRISYGHIIEGRYEKDINSIINETINGENIQDIMNNASNLVANANDTIVSLGNIFDEITRILKEIRPNVVIAGKNLEKATTNLANISDNLDNALNRTTTENSVDNLEKTTENLKNITKQIDEITIPEVNSILCETKSAMENTSEITNGIKCTLKKHLGLMKLFFGKPVKECND